MAQMIVGIRHAQVHNPEGLVYARLPGFHLSEAGRDNAARLRDALATAPVEAIHASPLERAKETATILAEPHGLRVEEDERLAEWAFWVRWQGLPWSRIRERDPDLLEAFAKDPAEAAPGDTLAMAAENVMAWAREAEAAHPAGLVLGVGHEAPLLAALLTGSGRSLAEYHSMHVPHLGAVRLLPGPAELIDLPAWAHRC